MRGHIRSYSAAPHPDQYDTTVVAEGIETQAELLVLRDLGVRYGQGYYIGRPSTNPARALPAEVLKALGRRNVPERQHFCAEMPISAESVNPNARRSSVRQARNFYLSMVRMPLIWTLASRPSRPLPPSFPAQTFPFLPK